MNDIWLGANLWNDIDSVKRCWPSIIPMIDGAILVDGSYPEYPTPYDNSTDGTIDWIREEIQRVGKRVDIIRSPERRTEVQKRTSYFTYADTNLDWKQLWLLVWDSDFQLAPAEGYNWGDVRQEWNQLRSNYDSNLVTIPLDVPYTKEDTKGSIFHLGFHNTPGLKYEVNHFRIVDGAGMVVRDQLPTTRMRCSKILHWHLDKTQERIDQRSYYSSRIVGKYER